MRTCVPQRGRVFGWGGWVLFVLIVVQHVACAPELPGADRGETGKATTEEAIPLAGPSDRAMEDRLRGIFAQIDGLEDFDVEVSGGVVRLSGESRSLDKTDRAVGIAGRLEGVVVVDNDIRQLTSLSSRLRQEGRELIAEARDILAYVPVLMAAVATVVFFAWFSGWVARRKWPLEHLNMSDLTRRVARMALRILVATVGLLLGLEILGVTGIVTAIVGTLGLVGVAIGLIFKDWAGNFVPGMMLGLSPPFEAGDLVQIGTDEGRIVRITARDTVLLTTDGEELRIPNARVVDERVLNLSKHPRRRLRVPLSLNQGIDLRETRDLGIEALREVRGALDDPAPFMRTIAILADRIDVEFYVWIDQYAVNFRNAESRARRAVTEALRAAGIQFPTLMIGLAQPSEERRPEEAPRPLGPEEPELGDGLDEEFYRALVREEQESSAERDLLTEGRQKQRAHESTPGEAVGGRSAP